MSDRDFLKEYLREAFMEGALDLGRDRKFMEGFLRVFAGEMEAVVAVQQATYLDLDERKRFMEIASPTTESVGHYKAWHDRAVGRSR